GAGLLLVLLLCLVSHVVVLDRRAGRADCRRLLLVGVVLVILLRLVPHLGGRALHGAGLLLVLLLCLVGLVIVLDRRAGRADCRRLFPHRLVLGPLSLL